MSMVTWLFIYFLLVGFFFDLLYSIGQIEPPSLSIAEIVVGIFPIIATYCEKSFQYLFLTLLWTMGLPLSISIFKEFFWFCFAAKISIRTMSKLSYFHEVFTLPNLILYWWSGFISVSSAFLFLIFIWQIGAYLYQVQI